MSQHAGIHMGHGQMVEIIERGDDHWELVFSEEGVENYPAPPLEEVEMDAIDTTGRIHPLRVRAGSSLSTVGVSGHVADAYRVRIRVLHGTHFHTREALLPGATSIAPRFGPNGGALADFGSDSIEIKPIDEKNWRLIFLANGEPTSAPEAETVTVQAIGPRPEDYQIRNLKTSKDEGGMTLTVSGKIKDAVHARIVLNEEIRSVPILPYGV